MYNTLSNTQSDTYSEAKARHSMDKVFEDFTAIIIMRFTTQERIIKWKEDLLYLMHEKVLTFFEIQFTKPDGTIPAIRYYVKADNSLSEDSSSGSLGLYSLPEGTKANLYAHLNSSSPNYVKANEELHTNRGWGTGNQVEGVSERQHSYSKDGYGVDRYKIGTW